MPYVPPKMPEYLDEPIDILADTALEITEKLAYKAHSGTYVEGLFDASLSTCVGVIHHPVDWQPACLNFHTGDLKLSYDPEVSEVPEYCKHSGLNTFHGYVSEPPIAPAFKESMPVGLAAPALRAYGKLEALLEFEGRDDEIDDLKDYFCNLWGADPSVLENTRFLKPSLLNRSDTDLLKSLRSKSHRLYGYENEQNYVSVTMGNYTQTSMAERRYVDWHRIGIILRYIGVFLLTSDDLGRAKLWDKNSSIQYGIVGREFPLVVNAPHGPSLKNMPKNSKIDFLNQALSTAMRYYSSHHVTSAVSHSLMLQQSKVRISPDFQLDSVAIAVLRRGLTTDQKAIELRMVTDKPNEYDIAAPPDSGSRPSRRSLYNDMKIHHQISVYRAVELFLMLKLHSHWKQKTSVTLRQIHDRLKGDHEKPLEFKMATARAIIVLLGQKSGEDIWQLFQRFRRDLTLAQEDFISFCIGMTDHSIQLSSVNMPLLWWDSIRKPGSYPTLKKVYQSSWTKYVHNLNHPSVPKFPTDSNLREYSELSDMTLHLWGKKRFYWVGHYKQRRDDWARFIRENPNALPELLEIKKSELIRYQWLCRWLQEYTPVVQNQLEVWPEIHNVKAVKLLQNTMQRYTRKRDNSSLHALPNEPYKSYARRLDTTLHPRVPFLTLLNTVHTTAKQITGDIAYMYRKILDETQLEEHEETIEDVWRTELTKHYYEEEKWAELSKRWELDGKVNWADYDEDDEIVDLPTVEILREKAKERAEALIHMRPTTGVTSLPQEVEEEEQLQELDEEDPHEFSDPEFGDEFDDIDPTKVVFATTTHSETFSQDLLRRKSPLTEIYEKYGKVPSVTEWALRAGCTLEELRAVSLDKFEDIFEMGIQLLTENRVEEDQSQIGYDVL